MLTPSHVLLSIALCSVSEKKRSLRVTAATVGALIPDVSIFIMWGQARLRGVKDHKIWSELYYSDFWQEAGALTNSMPLFLLLWAIGMTVNSKWSPECAHKWIGSLGLFVAMLGFSALLHTLLDLPLHHDDGHPHFWPFTDWIYASPVSYWDVEHYASLWQPIEIVLSATCMFFLWRRFSGIFAKVLLVIAAVSYVALGVFFIGGQSGLF